MPLDFYMALRRVFYGNDYMARPRQSYEDGKETDEFYQMKSLLNIVADSGDVQIFLITK